MGRNLLRPETWHRKVVLRQGHTIYFNNGHGVESHAVLDSFYNNLNGRLTIRTACLGKEHHLETKWGLIILGTRYAKAMNMETRELMLLRLDGYAKFHSSRRKATRDKPMEFWDAGFRGCTIVPRRKKVKSKKKRRTTSVPVQARNYPIQTMGRDMLLGNFSEHTEIRFVEDKAPRTYQIKASCHAGDDEDCPVCKVVGPC